MTAPVAGLRLGAPGVYRVPRRSEPAFQPVRLDVAGFVGVALRGPVHTPVLVRRWSDYEQTFGGFERPADCPERLLPYAVQAFFAHGGERAYVLRVAPPDDGQGPDSGAATARFRLDFGPSGVVEISAANEGAWGNDLAIRLEFDVGQRFRVLLRHDGFDRPAGAELPVGSLLRLQHPRGLPAAGVFRWVRSVVKGHVVLDEPVPVDVDVEVAVITGALVVTDGGAARHYQERVSGLGLHPEHPRFVPGVLETESLLVRAPGEWATTLVPPDPLLRPVAAKPVQSGADRWPAIDYFSFFDDGDATNDPLDEERHRGVDQMGREGEIGLLCVPDLYWRVRQAPVPPPPAPAPFRIGCECCPCCGGAGCVSGPELEPAYTPSEAAPPVLDARNPDDLQEIVQRQMRLIQVADLRRRFVALLDVPAGLSAQGIARWRADFQSSYAAGYHPWLGVPRPDSRRETVPVPPSAFAAGITAARERRLGLPWGPANELAVGAVRATDLVSDTGHDELHLLGINVFRAERDGFRLTAARTLSTDPEYRQLSVRRLMTMIALTLDRQAQWLVFEPNTAALREQLTHMLTQFLRDLHRRNTFAGGTEAESFFVRCTEELNPPASQALGRLIAEVGVAPAAPLEYLVLRISQDADGALQVVTGRD